MTCIYNILEGQKEKCMSEIKFSKNICLNFWKNLFEFWICSRIFQSFGTFIASLKFIKKYEKIFDKNLGLAKLNSDNQFFYWHLTCAT